ncbi:MAG: hypothetical protein A3D28_05675 [Omnitrophica bacterium RIFCSPHIGHO2_02_FULL_63_14]|nr:MAG: hypothetical protein A3D28_05675 [Omnitrophica bacterium RIFCSPHIGHO2_02_FULL_63_14]
MKKQAKVSAGGVVLNPYGEVLVVNQNGNSWSLPKGHIDPGEDVLDAARREIREESGIGSLRLIKGLGSYERFRIGVDGREDRSELKLIHMYLFTTDETALKPVDPQNPEARWVKKGEVAKLLTHKKDKAFFKALLSKGAFGKSL